MESKAKAFGHAIHPVMRFARPGGRLVGGELVERLGVGVSSNASLKAPNSLKQVTRAILIKESE